tara:strand:+ start:12749 stop:13978 length:1230 start_codon:yes stop_codon:yes gene_type:complete
MKQKQKKSLKNNMLSFFDSRKNNEEYSNQEIKPTERERSFLDYYSSNIFIQESMNSKNIPAIKEITNTGEDNDFIFRKKKKNALDNTIVHLENIENKLKSLTENSYNTTNNIHNKRNHILNNNDNTHKSYEKISSPTLVTNNNESVSSPTLVTNNNESVSSPTLVTNNNESVMKSINSIKNNTTAKYIKDYADLDAKHTLPTNRMITNVIRVNGDNIPKILSQKYNVQNNRMKEYHTNDISTTLVSNIEKILPQNKIMEIPSLSLGGVARKPTIAQIGDAPFADPTEVVMSPKTIPAILAKANVIEKTNKLLITKQATRPIDSVIIEKTKKVNITSQAKKTMDENSVLKIQEDNKTQGSDQEAIQPVIINAPNNSTTGQEGGGLQMIESKSSSHLEYASRLPRWRTRIG